MSHQQPPSGAGTGALGLGCHKRSLRAHWRAGESSTGTPGWESVPFPPTFRDVFRQSSNGLVFCRGRLRPVMGGWRCLSPAEQGTPSRWQQQQQPPGCKSRAQQFFEQLDGGFFLAFMGWSFSAAHLGERTHFPQQRMGWIGRTVKAHPVHAPVGRGCNESRFPRAPSSKLICDGSRDGAGTTPLSNSFQSWRCIDNLP